MKKTVSFDAIANFHSPQAQRTPQDGEMCMTVVGHDLKACRPTPRFKEKRLKCRLEKRMQNHAMASDGVGRTLLFDHRQCPDCIAPLLSQTTAHTADVFETC